MFFKKYQLRSYNFRLVALLVITSIYSLLVVNSANSSYTTRQGIGMLLSFVVMIVVSFIDYNWIIKYYWLWYIISTILLLAVKVVGVSAKGAKRWLGIGSFTIQPSEFTKLILILVLAKLIQMYKEKLNTYKFVGVLAATAGFQLLLVLSQPDLSTTLLTFLICVVVIYCAGLEYRIIGRILAIAIPLIILVLAYIILDENQVIVKKYQRNRIMTFINSNYDVGDDEEDEVSEDDTYQQNYAVQAIGSGQLSGKGLNNDDSTSLKNAGYIAEAQNDFIFAVIGEELGFIGSVFTILLIFLIVTECLITAAKAQNLAGRLICCGIAAYIGFQTFFNIGVVTWILPNTGIPLPFFSAGITSLITLYTSMGIVLNVGLHTKVERDEDLFAPDFKG
ncbi:FtsW/RodA/SpoVE family cell cycle protein [Lachnospira multipara]|uniref:FtsW/RodA/SpoVE family cell cycle protein n=1 Tax=Lachnospira multipara TaxID=28051 RepID=UPI0004E1E13C|nr:FtsW/RodA/SpoVE family cell cycle protein [Lachnospira multipara]